jgi:hypothetical protein
MLVFKCLINSVVSTKGAKCMMLDITHQWNAMNTCASKWQTSRMK